MEQGEGTVIGDVNSRTCMCIHCGIFTGNRHIYMLTLKSMGDEVLDLVLVGHTRG